MSFKIAVAHTDPAGGARVEAYASVNGQLIVAEGSDRDSALAELLRLVEGALEVSVGAVDGVPESPYSRNIEVSVRLA